MWLEQKDCGERAQRAIVGPKELMLRILTFTLRMTRSHWRILNRRVM